jgi:MFS family permease
VTIRDRLGPLRERPFRLLFTARTISDAGSNIATVAYAFAILDLTGSASDLGFAFVARTLPILAFILLGGVLADRLPRRRMMVVADIVRAATQGTVAALLLTGHARLWELIALQVAFGCGDAVFTPAWRGLVPQLVGVERLQQANALLSFSGNTNAILGPALGGVLVALVDPGAALAVDAASFAVGIVVLLGVDVPARVPAPAEPLRRALAVGFRAVRERQWLSVCLACDSVFQLLVLSSLFVLGPKVAHDQLGGAGAWAAALAALGVGSLVGDLVSLRYRPARPLLACRLTPLPLAAALVLLATTAPVVWIAAGFAFAGLGLSMGGTLWFTLLQHNVPDELRSRVASVDTLVSRGLLPVGYGLVGVVATHLGDAAVLIAAAAAIVVLEGLSLAVPSVRDLPAHVPAHAPA